MKSLASTDVFLRSLDFAKASLAMPSESSWRADSAFNQMVTPLAATFAGAVSLNIECQQSSVDFRLRTRYVDKQARDIDHAFELIQQHTAAKEAVSIALLGNASDILPELVRRAKAGGLKPDLVTDQTSAHDLVNGYLPAGWTVAQWRAAQQDVTQHLSLIHI